MRECRRYHTHCLCYSTRSSANQKEDSFAPDALRNRPEGPSHHAMAYADVERSRRALAKIHLWPWHSGGIAVVFNFRQGPFQDKRLCAPRAAHAIDAGDSTTRCFYVSHVGRHDLRPALPTREPLAPGE